jgi:hypothetical protein
MVRERFHSNELQTLQRELHFGLLGILLDCEEREREKLPRVFWEAAMSSSSSMQQVQCPSATSNSVEGHKSSSSSSTTAWRRESSTRRSLLLRVCVHLQWTFILVIYFNSFTSWTCSSRIHEII